MADINIQDDIIFPEPENQKEIDLYKTLQDTHRQVVDTFSAFEDIAAITAGDGLLDTSDVFSVRVDTTTIEITADVLNVVDGGIGSDQLANTSVITAKIADDAVTEAKLQFSNNAFMEALISGGGSTVDLIKANTTNYLEFGTEITFSTGAVIKLFSVDTTLVDNSDQILPTQKAIKTYIDSNTSGTGIEVFTASGTFNVPSDVSFVLIDATGQGGGASRGIDAGNGGGGGGAGEYVQDYGVSVTPGGTVTVTLANTGGVGGTGASGAPGTAGSNAVFGSITLLGGGLGTGATAGSGGGSGVFDASTTTGGSGFQQGGDGAAGAGDGGGGGANPFGSGGDGGSGSSAGDNATGFGAGGGGGDGSPGADGGNGSDGVIIVKY